MTIAPASLATFARFLWSEANLVVTAGEIGPVIQGMTSYNARHRIGGPLPETLPAITRLLAGVALAAVSLPERESWGWTLPMPGTPFGIFAGVEPEGMVCCRLLSSVPDRSIAVIQRKVSGEPLCQSVIDSPDRDPAEAVQRYFEHAEQNRTRLAVDAAGKGVLIHALPGGDFERVAETDGAELIARIDRMRATDALRPIGEVILFYECRCHDGMIRDLIGKMPSERRQALWGDLLEIEMECPRCARTYVVRKQEVVFH